MFDWPCYYVVGDKYQQFAELPDVFTFSQVIEPTGIHHDVKHCYLILGQGISAKERSMLKQLEQQNKIGMIVNRHHLLADAHLSHKAKLENTMITDPLVEQASHRYVSYLLLDDDCAEVSDHITGMHLQGMVLTEAARQMMLAVGEKYLLPENLKNNSYFALKKVNSVFHQFAFPIETKLIHEVIKLRSKAGMHFIDTKTYISQNEHVLSEIEINYVASQRQRIHTAEHEIACRAINVGKQSTMLEIYVDRCA